MSSSWSLGVASYLDKKKYSLKLNLYFSRFEQEKENSFKELQKQSIEYEKKLQDQLEERNQELDSLRASHKRAKTERKAFEKARSALEVGFSNLYFYLVYGKCHKILPFFSNVPVSFCLFVVKILATVAQTFTKIEKTERKAFDKESSALEVGFSNLYFLF